MAKIDINTLFKTLRGKIGDLVFRHMPDGSLVVTGVPRKRKKDSTAQKAHKSRFAEGSGFARWAQHEYPIYAELAAGRPMITAYNMALSDFFHAPVIHRILRKEFRDPRMHFAVVPAALGAPLAIGRDYHRSTKIIVRGTHVSRPQYLSLQRNLCKHEINTAKRTVVGVSEHVNTGIVPNSHA